MKKKRKFTTCRFVCQGLTVQTWADRQGQTQKVMTLTSLAQHVHRHGLLHPSRQGRPQPGSPGAQDWTGLEQRMIWGDGAGKGGRWPPPCMSLAAGIAPRALLAPRKVTHLPYSLHLMPACPRGWLCLPPPETVKTSTLQASRPFSPADVATSQVSIWSHRQLKGWACA